jgi:hypothetical protein
VFTCEHSVSHHIFTVVRVGGVCSRLQKSPLYYVSATEVSTDIGANFRRKSVQEMNINTPLFSV